MISKARRESRLDVRGLGYLGGGPHAISLASGPQPWQRSLAYALERARAGARFPDAGAEEIDACAREPARRLEDLFLALRGAGPRNDEWAPLDPGPV